jgi:hypothetical protein
MTVFSVDNSCFVLQNFIRLAHSARFELGLVVMYHISDIVII